ncbi:MAG TPA: hypothetical protein VM223_19515, partial [Planctomycetota bacterium]|nr:hypothetical protein [Planctomycetota bacterium]
MPHDRLCYLGVRPAGGEQAAGGVAEGVEVDEAAGDERLASTFSNTTALDGYDAFGRVTRIHHYKTDGPVNLVDYTYTYDTVNRLSQEDALDATKSELYTYDTLNRLLTFKRGEIDGGEIAEPSRDQTWVFDSLGNWLEVDSNTEGDPSQPTDDRTHDLANAITYIDEVQVQHDEAGNLYILPDRTDPEHVAYRFIHDYRNRLARIEETDEFDEDPETRTWTTKVRYYYDALNRLVRKHLTSTNDIMYTYDGWRCVEES